MYLLIPTLPLVGAILGGFFGRYIGGLGSAIICTSMVGMTCILSFMAAYEVAFSGSPCYIQLGPWISTELLDANWGFLFDTVSVVLLVTVTVVSTFVHIYSSSYMGEDPHQSRFMSYLSLFTFFMIILVTGDNFLQMFLGWEGVGLSSYLLISFWYTRILANQAAIKAMVVNRIGDFGLALGIFGIYMVFKTIDFTTVFAMVPAVFEANETFNICGFELPALTTISLLLFVGAVGKSAQIGLHTWLPDAMEGPTPVSALIHAATMVTAGVYLLIRCSPLISYSPTALGIITFFGGITALIAATIGLVQNDIKKVIAYSTCSQLGYMVFACGLSNYELSLFHLSNHAYFKGLLFLTAGSVIHAIADEQDVRRMGGLINILPFTYTLLLIGSLALMGFPFLTGFYSKEVILSVAYATFTVEGTFVHWLGSLAAFFTSFYSIRLLYLTFIANPKSGKAQLEHAHDAPPAMAIPLFCLGIASIFVGYLTRDMIIGMGTNFFGNSILSFQASILEAEFLPYTIKLIPLVVSILGASLSFYLYSVNLPSKISLIMLTNSTNLSSKIFYHGYTFLNKKWYFDKVYNQYLAGPALQFAYQVTFKTIDKGILELLGPYGIAQTIVYFTQQIRKLQSGYIYHYAFFILIGVTLFTGYGILDASFDVLI